MNKSEFIELRLQALESGEYKQCRGALRQDNDGEFRYCCLGVATHLANKFKVKNYGGKTDLFEIADALLPASLARFLNIENDGSFKYRVLHRGESYGSLTALNDRGVRFKTIARTIREQLTAKNFNGFK